MNTRNGRRNLIALCLALFIVIGAHAQVPKTINYQGFLASSTNVPVNNPSQAMTFSLYNSANTLLWSETQNVTVTNGVFNVVLGTGTPVSPPGVTLGTLPFNAQYFLGVKVGSEEMSPRQALAASPYAFRASNLDSAAVIQGSQISGTISNVTISGATLVGLQLSDAAVCDPAHQGALRWVAATMSFEGCTGNAWMPFVQEPLIRVTTVASEGRYISVKIGADGLPVIAYYGGGDLIVAKCANPACTGTTSITSVDTPSVGWYASLAIGADGLPVISYQDIGNNHLKVAKCANAACTGASTITTVDSADFVGLYTSIAIGADGLPVISYVDSYQALRVAKCANAACTGTSTITTVEQPGSVDITTTSVAVGADGLPVIAYQAKGGTYGNLRVIKCGDAACASNNTFANPDYNGAGASNSIAIGADGLPVISYTIATLGYNPGYLYVAKCSDAACSTVTSYLLDSGSSGVGAYNSIAIGADGLPVVSYIGVGGSVRLAKCSNAACSATTFSVIDSASSGYTSVAIGADSRPVVAYSGGGLKFAKCTMAQGACK